MKAVIIIRNTKSAGRMFSAFVFAVPLLLLVYFLLFPALAAESVRRALTVCSVSLIPSLFPFIVLVGVMNGMGISRKLSRLVGAPIGHLLGVDPEAVYAVFLGALGGFPIGAVCVRELYDSGRLTKNEAQRLVALSSNAGPAFCIAALGGTMLKSHTLGVKLYICQLAVVLVIGIMWRPQKRVAAVTPVNDKALPFADALTGAVGNGAMTMLKICAFAVFFAVIGDLACSLTLHCFGIYTSSFTAAILELTLAGRYAAELDGRMSAVIAAFAVGWSGISVHMQTASVLSGSGLSLSVFRRVKLAQGVLCALVMYVLR